MSLEMSVTNRVRLFRLTFGSLLLLGGIALLTVQALDWLTRLSLT